jgi:uncharacterized protein YbjT (DUF2867 family)
MNHPKVLIVGATGKQGQATIAALHASAAQPSPFRILALTRSASSEKATALKEKYPDVTLVEGSSKRPESIFAAHPDISAIFLVTVPSDEEAQAIPLIDAAVTSSNKVDHIVFSSVDRGGNKESWTQPTTVPHFAAKHRIELHLRDACDGAGKRWTILRPTGFMDNYNPGFFGSMMASLWAAGMPPERKMQLVSTHDIGVFAAKALLDPGKWAGRAVGLAGDELTLGEAQAVFERAVGQQMPTTWGFVAKGVMWWVEEARVSFEWFARVGFGVDMDMLRNEEPRLQTFEEWLGQQSGWSTEVRQASLAT